MKKINNLIDRLVQGIVVFLVLAILVTILAQVISRYVFNAPFMWTEELARSIGIWLVFLCSGIVVRENRHLGFEILPGAWKPILRLIANLSIIFFSLCLLWQSATFIKVGLGIRSTALQIPLWLLYSAIPVGSLLMIIFGFENVREGFKRYFPRKASK